MLVTITSHSSLWTSAQVRDAPLRGLAPSAPCTASATSPNSSAWAHTRDVGFAHQPLDPFAADVDALTFEDGVHARRAVVAAGCGMDLSDLLGQLRVPAAPFARLLLRPAPPVVRRGGG